jgi:enoyl-CoA hydratase
MTAAPVLTDLSDGVLAVTLNRPERRNPLGRETVAALRAAFEAHADDPTIRLALLTGSGDRAFAAGGDLKESMAVRDEAAALAFSRTVRAAFEAVRAFPVPVAAVLNGDALGGGAELALACDLRIAAPHARIAFLQSRLAISTAWGGGIDLIRAVGPARALDLLASGRPVGAEEALALGLVQALGGAAEARARWGTAPAHTMRAFKALVRAAPADRAAVEEARFVETWLHPDHWAAAEAAVAALKKG